MEPFYNAKTRLDIFHIFEKVDDKNVGTKRKTRMTLAKGVVVKTSIFLIPAEHKDHRGAKRWWECTYIVVEFLAGNRGNPSEDRGTAEKKGIKKEK